MAIYFSGDTVRLICEFKDWDGKPADPKIVKVRVYSNSYELVEELTDIIRKDIGKYYVNYVMPNTGGSKMYYEWYAEIDGYPSVVRGHFIGVFQGG